ncbi:MAG: hypothetical protein C6I00_01330 [Nitratiruptor sp.]|nr:hypothetical protein [Nitratiruptor sp.]NPA83238.1 pimelyl-ACP methyl ester esterase BioV [Campylobacterota bacterium]
MQFFSGFGFAKEARLFQDYLDPRGFVVAGFSYGAQLAFQEALARLDRGERVEKVQLLAPAYFDHRPPSWKERELQAFEKDPTRYMELFYKRALFPARIDLTPYTRIPSREELYRLLFFTWDLEQLARLREGGVVIECFLGSQDRIVDTMAARSFFQPFSLVYWIEGAGHLLRRRDDGSSENRHRHR